MSRGHLRGVKLSECLVKPGSMVDGKNKGKPCLQALWIEPGTHPGDTGWLGLYSSLVQSLHMVYHTFVACNSNYRLNSKSMGVTQRQGGFRKL